MVLVENHLNNLSQLYFLVLGKKITAISNKGFDFE